MTDSAKFFGKEPPARPVQGIGFNITFGTATIGYYEPGPPPPPPPPQLVTVNSLHDTLKYTELGGEFQFKDSVTAWGKWAAFSKECKDTENLWNAPIRIKLKQYWDSAHAKQRKDSIAYRVIFVADSIAKANQHTEDSIFKCQHTYTSN